MQIDGNILGVFQSTEEFQFSIPTEDTDKCRFAQAFSEWAEKLCQVLEDPTVFDVNAAKIQLVDKYFAWYSSVPKRHQSRLGDRGHTCIYQVFVETYLILREIELSITPPLFLEPPASQIGGIFLGEIDEE